MNLVLKASLLRSSRTWMIELNKDLIFSPRLTKGPCLIHGYLKVTARLRWAEAVPIPQPAEQICIWERGSSVPWASVTGTATCLAMPPGSHTFVSITIFQGQTGTLLQQNLPFFPGDLLLTLLWFPSSAQALNVRSIAVCKLREFSNYKLIAQRDTGSFRSLFLFITFVWRDKFSLCYTALKPAASQ